MSYRELLLELKSKPCNQPHKKTASLRDVQRGDVDS